MIVIGGALIGAVWGGLVARKRGGSRWDIAQYAAAAGIALALVGMILTIVLDRTLL